MRSERAVRVVLGLAGVGLIAFGGLRILQNQSDSHPLRLGVWLVGALALHDALIAPFVISVGWVLARILPGRVRRYVQPGLVVAGLVSVVGIVLIDRQGKTSSPALALLKLNYALNVAILLAIIAAATVLTYGVAVVRTRRTNVRSSATQ